MTDSSPKDGLDTFDSLDGALLNTPLLTYPAEDSGTSSSGCSSHHSESPRNEWTWNQDTKVPSLDELGSFTTNWPGLDMDTPMSAFLGDQPSIDPSALHFPGSSLFQFTLAPPDTIGQPLQLPTPKPGSTSSRSTSPVPIKSERDTGAGVSPSDVSLFDQLSQRARDATGIMLAIPAEHQQLPVSPVSPVSQAPAPPSRVPIPRLRPSSSPSTLLSAKNSIVPTVTHPTPPASVTAPSPLPTPIATEKPVRTKTSHTTIERRYRTNLNARILALRRAVPALRILEKNSPSQTQGKGFTGATAPKWDFDDVVNERGYVDGVKAAKKNSKGVVLGKAVEYIMSLKRREARLRHESDGLRALLSGLVGGPELLREWEHEWRARFGGEEADEVDEDEGEVDIEMDGDDGEGEEDSDLDDARVKKRARTAKPTNPVGEKRKRGRPRKHPAPPTIPAVPPVASVAPASVVHPSASKSLLAFVLIFSLFGNGTPPGSNTGEVLTAAPEIQASGWSLLQSLHAIVSVLLLVSLVRAYLPRALTRAIPDVSILAALPSLPQSPVREEALPMRDEDTLRAALGAKGGVWGVLRAVLMRMLRLRLPGDLPAWRRVGELDVLRGSATPLLGRMQTYFELAAHTSRAPAHSITLALLSRTFWPTSAAEHWADARRAENSTAAEKLVLDMDVDDAASVLTAAISSTGSPVSSTSSNTSDSEDDADTPSSPVRLIAEHAVLAHAKMLAANEFVAAVTGVHPDVPSDDAASVRAAGRELGGELAALTYLLEQAARGEEVLPGLESDTDLDADIVSGAGAVRALLRATLLFRRVFSLGQKGATLHLALRRVLASPAFEINAATEEARDRVVDMLAEARRAR